MTTPVETPPMSLSQRFADTDSHSDSDWLDISSNPDLSDSDDDGSVSIPDSDHPVISATTRSRRSSISSISSKAGDVEAWEGFVSEIEDDSPPSGHVSDLAQASPSSTDMNTPFIDPEADQRATLALEQSLISTLSGSRSNSHPSTVQNSYRDLRLSFPDPLTSSQDNLNTYPATIPEDDLVVEHHLSLKDEVERPLEATQENDEPIEELASTSAVQLALPSMDLHLYGSSWAGRESFTSRFMDKCLPDMSLAVYDHTSVSDEKPTPSATIPDGRPSLAMIFLPNSNPVSFIHDHSFYLPVIIDSQWDDAQSQCESLRIPTEKIFPVQQLNGSLFQAALVDLLEPGDGEAELRSLAMRPRTSSSVASSCKKFVRDPLQGGVTFFALAYLILSFFSNTVSSPAPMAATPTQEAVFNASVTSAVSIRSPSSISVHSMFSLPYDQTSQRALETGDNVFSLVDQVYSTAVAIRSSAALAIPTSFKMPTSPSVVELEEEEIEEEVVDVTQVASTSSQSLSLRMTSSLSGFYTQTKEYAASAVGHIKTRHNRAKGKARGQAEDLKVAVDTVEEKILDAVEEACTQVFGAVEDTRVQVYNVVEDGLQKLDAIEEFGVQLYNKVSKSVSVGMEKAHKRVSEQKKHVGWGSSHAVTVSGMRLHV